jgi:ABC-2 type transport system ATP-binding protein
MAAGNAIEVRGLVREFKKGPRAVDGIDLHVEWGSIYGFLGPNGAGKSTTVKILTTLLPPSGGTAQVAGFDVAREGALVRRVIGAALQEAAVDPMLNAREHLRLQAGLHGFSKAAAKARAEELLERVALTGAADRKISGYSGGMKRRLDLALALVHSPKIIFLDEPTTGLDPQSRTALWEEVSRLAREDGVTVFLTTQYLEEADVLAERVGIIDQGRIVAEGTPSDLKAEIGRSTVEVVPARPEDAARLAAILAPFGQPVEGSPTGVAVRLAQMSALPEAVRAIDAGGIEIAHLELRAPTLDDVFLEKTGRSLEGATDEVPEGKPPEEEAAGGVVGGTAVVVIDWIQRTHVGDTGLGAHPLLLIRDGPRAGQSVAIEETLVIGREADLAIDDPEVSRRHAVFRASNGSLIVEDLGSMNGTWVNGERITVPTAVVAGDQIKLGRTFLEVQPDRSGAGSTSPGVGSGT